MPRTCSLPSCTRNCYGEFCLMHKPRKPLAVKTTLPRSTKRIKQQSDKEKQYQVYKETVIRPAVIERDGNACWCCHRPAYDSEKLDLEHTKTKGSRPDLKRDITQIRLYCRFPCHNNKTDGKPCHGNSNKSAKVFLWFSVYASFAVKSKRLPRTRSRLSANANMLN